MDYLLIYHGGDVPEDNQKQNIKELWSWLETLKQADIEKVRFLLQPLSQLISLKHKKFGVDKNLLV